MSDRKKGDIYLHYYNDERDDSFINLFLKGGYKHGNEDCVKTLEFHMYNDVYNGKMNINLTKLVDENFVREFSTKYEKVTKIT